MSLRNVPKALAHKGVGRSTRHTPAVCGEVGRSWGVLPIDTPQGLT
jgi:hypothetical protein